MPTPIVSSALALMLSSAPVEPQYLPSTVEVDVDLLVTQAPDEGEEFRRLERITSDRTGAQVRTSVQEALETHGVPVGGDAPSAKVVVTLEWKVYLDSHYVAHLVARHEDGTEKTVTVECRMCDEPKLAATVAEHVPELLPSLEVVPEPAVVEAPPEGGEPQGDEPPSSPVTSGGDEEAGAEQGRRIGPVGWAGIASLVLGAGSTIGGAVLLREDSIVRFQAQDDHVEETVSRRPKGIAFTAVGATLLGAGVVMVIIDQTVLRRRRARQNVAAHVFPSAFPAGAGLTVAGRF